MPMNYFSLIMSICPILTGNFLFLSNQSFSKTFINFCKSFWIMVRRHTYLTIHDSEHSLSSIFWILITSFLGWFSSFGTSIKLLSAKGLYFEILILMHYDWLNNPARNFVWYNCSLDWFKYIIITVTFITIVSAFDGV